jgi:NADH:ubiquinone oxidoreductase subunit C
MASSLELAQQLKVKFGDLISEPAEFRGELTVIVSDAQRIAEVAAFCKAELGFDYLVDASGVDSYGEDPRWALVYELFSHAKNVYLRLKTSVSEEKSELPTVSGVWRTADWHEREVYDMMGVRFSGHPDGFARCGVRQSDADGRGTIRDRIWRKRFWRARAAHPDSRGLVFDGDNARDSIRRSCGARKSCGG